METSNETKTSVTSRIKKLKEKPIKEVCSLLVSRASLFIVNKMCFIISKEEREQSKKIRRRYFMDFTNKYIKETDFEISESNIPNDLSDRYDYFVAGSDQVWNPNYNFDSSIHFLEFAEEKKRVAYAPSFGVSSIPEIHKRRYSNWLKGIPNLSVREDDGAMIVRELTGIKIPVVVDPTILLTKEDWQKVAKAAANKPKQSYLLTYFLGGVPFKYKKQIEKIAKENNLKIINLGDIKESETYKTGPSEYIDYISSCSILCTDSFHGTVFAILFEKPFIVYERNRSASSMFSRIETLLRKFKLEDRIADYAHNLENVFDMDYSHVTSMLEEERKMGLEFLEKSLNEKIEC